MPETPARMAASPPPAKSPTAVPFGVKSAVSGSYVHRLGLTRRCCGKSRASRAPIDLTNVLNYAPSLAQLVTDLFLPFGQMHVDQIIAIHVEDNIQEIEDISNYSKEENQDEKKSMKKPRNARKRQSVDGMYLFTTAIAGAMAGANQLAYSEMTVLRNEKNASTRKRKLPEKKHTATDMNTDTCCKQIASIDNAANTGLCVEMKRIAIKESARVLLVIDWIDSVDILLAARDAIEKLGADVVGVSFVVATKANLLCQLKRLQIPFSCSWTPSDNAELDIMGNRDHISLAVKCICHHQADHRNDHTPGKRKRSQDEEAKIPIFAHYTSQYQANSPGEDRSVNICKPDDSGIRINAVFDGHGGSVAVEHLRATLCQRILHDVSSDKSTDEVKSLLVNSFCVCEEELKRILLSLPPATRMSKGYCNTGSCAVVALFVDSSLYIANVGDCMAVLGKTDKVSGESQAIELSTDHSCYNSDEVRLVIERSRDRNAIRSSKDGQANRVGEFGVKRVAGSLAVTRAFGDFYLKCEELSIPPFKSKVPYITAEPTVSVRHLDGSEKYLILASDGLWEVMTPEEAVKIVDRYDPTQSLFFSTVSSALIHAALEKIAHRDGMMLHELLALPLGEERRRFHDDITCTVIYIKSNAVNGDITESDTIESTSL